MNDRKAFTFYRSYYEIAMELPKKERLEFLTALIKIQFTGEVTELNGLAKFAYLSQNHSINRQLEGFKHGGKRDKPCELPYEGTASIPCHVPSPQEKEEGEEKGKVEGKGEGEGEHPLRDFKWFEKQIDEIWTDQLPKEKKANLGAAIQNAWEYLSADSLRLKAIDSSGCKQLVSKAFQYLRYSGNTKTPPKKSFNLSEI